MQMTPLLDIALGLFLTVFGVILERLGRSQLRESGLQGASWQLAAFALMTLLAAGAALMGAWVYWLGRETQFLLQMVIASLVFFAGLLNIRRLRRARNPSLKLSLRTFNDSMLWLAGMLMAVCGGLILLTYPLTASNPGEPFLVTAHTAAQVVGVAAGFSAIVFMLASLFTAEP